jgi:hypothetical protein
VVQALSSQLYRAGPGSRPGHSILDVLWTKWHWYRFFSEFFGSPLSISFHRYSICIYVVIVINSQVLFHNGSLLHAQFNTQLLITIKNSSKNLTPV